MFGWLLVALASPLIAQTVSGTVTDAVTHSGIPGAAIFLSSAANGESTFDTTSDAAGRFQFTGLPPGNYQAAAQKTHPLYPAGDPRAALLIRLAEASGNKAEWRLVRALRKAGSELLNELPNLDFGLAALARTYGLPEGAPLVLFALGRTAGWIAHAIEQYSSGELIRPRDRYTGPAPESGRPAEGSERRVGVGQ
jgi:hypothetical protein